MGLHGQNKCHAIGVTFGYAACTNEKKNHTLAFKESDGFVDSNSTTGIDSLWVSWHCQWGLASCKHVRCIPLA